MSASPVARAAATHTQTNAQSIPKRISINSPSELPNDYSTTPGGTLFSTTPGGMIQSSLGLGNLDSLLFNSLLCLSFIKGDNYLYYSSNY